MCDAGLWWRLVGAADADPRLHGEYRRRMPRRDMQGEPVVQAMGLYVVHGEANRECGCTVMIGTEPRPGHVSDDKPKDPEFGYPGPMKSFLGLLAILVGCGGDPADVEGSWTVAGTNRDNDCNIDNWNVGDTFNNVEVSFTQNGEDLNADVGGGGGFYLDLLLGGTAIFSGNIDGDDAFLTREGTRSMNQGNCTYTFNAEMDLHFDGDVFTGRLNYISATNGNSDCAAVQCENYQDVNGTRPPQ